MESREAMAIGERWVAACRRAGVEPWAAGMRWLAWPRAGRVVTASPGCVDFGAYIEHERLPVPVLDDPATLGAALGVLREAMSLPFIQLSPKLCLTPDRAGWALASGWVCYLNDRGERWFVGATEAEAIVAAAEALAAEGGR